MMRINKKNCYRKIFNLPERDLNKTSSENNYRKCLIRNGDMVKVIAGKSKNQTGKVVKFDRMNGKVTVDGLNLVTHFSKEKGIYKKEGAIHISNLMLIDKDNNPTRMKIGFNDQKQKCRISVKTGKEI